MASNTRLSDAESGALMDITDEEKDSNVEKYLLSGQRDQAITYVRDMLHVAKSMRDKKAIARYEKYFLVLRLGKPVSRRT